MASIRTRTTKDGKTRYHVRGLGIESRTFSRKADAVKYRDNTERLVALGPLYESEPETLGEALAHYLERKERYRWADSTARTFAETARNLDPLAHLPLSRLGVRMVHGLLMELAERAPRQAQKTRALLLAVLKDAQTRAQRIDPALLKIEPIKRTEREPQFLTVEQLDTLTSWLPEYVKRIVPVAGLSGMRQGELLSLTEGDLHLEDAEPWLMVRRSTTKTAAGHRKVKLNAEVTALIREQLLARPLGTPLVFPSPTGKRWDPKRFMGRVFRPAREAAGLPAVTFHDLRHTAVSLMAAAGWRPEHIAEQIGHADGGALILKRYRHCYPHELTDALARLDAYVATSRAGNGGHHVATGSEG